MAAAGGGAAVAPDGGRVPDGRLVLRVEDVDVVVQRERRAVPRAAEDPEARRAGALAAAVGPTPPPPRATAAWRARLRRALEGEARPHLRVDREDVEVGAVLVVRVEAAEDEEPRPAPPRRDERRRVRRPVRRPVAHGVRRVPAAGGGVVVVQVVQPVRLALDVRHPAEEVEPVAHRRERVVRARLRQRAARRDERRGVREREPARRPRRPRVLARDAAVARIAVALVARLAQLQSAPRARRRGRVAVDVDGEEGCEDRWPVEIRRRIR